MAISKVVFGNETLVDLTSDTVTADTLLVGVTAHDAAGNKITGTMSSGVPIGFVGHFASNSTPTGYLICDGSAVSRTTYSELYAVVGDKYGSTGNTTTFKLPNLIDKVIEGSKTVATDLAAGLPDIAGTVTATGVGITADVTATGAFSGEASTNTGGVGFQALDDTYSPKVSFKASDYNSIYGNSTTVQPPALTLLPCIKALNV